MLGQTVELGITGNVELIGVLIDYGLDVIVIFDGFDYVYFPSGHLRFIRLVTNVSQISEPTYDRIDLENSLSFRGILHESKGMFVKLFVSGNQAIHGYVTNVLTDYFIFFSPVYKTMLIPLFHLKWLIPYPQNQTPYSLSKKTLTANPAVFKMARTFEEQLKKMGERIVVFDLGSNPDKIGLIKNIQNNVVELISANQKPIYWNLQHIKTAHFPDL